MSDGFDPQQVSAFYLSDFVQMIREGKKRAFLFGLLAAGIFFVHLCLTPPQYKVEALFNESYDKKVPTENFLKDIVSSALEFSSKEGAQAAILMRSRVLIKRVVEECGLQIKVDKQIPCFFLWMKNLIDNCRAELHLPLRDKEEFLFSKVSFPLERKATYGLRFLSFKSFELLDDKGRVKVEGRIGEEIHLQKLRFTLMHTPKDLELHREYHLTFLPWIEVANVLLGKVIILPRKGNASFMQLLLYDRDRLSAVRILNQIMREYQLYLREESEKVSKEQIAYLEKRQEDLSSLLEKILDEHVMYLEKNLGAKGFLSLDHELESLLFPHQRCLSRLSHLDFKIDLLQRKGIDALGREISAFSTKIEDLKRQRDPLDLVFNKEKSPSLKVATSSLEEQKDSQKRLFEVEEELLSLQNKKNHILNEQTSLPKELESLQESQRQCSLERNQLIQWMERQGNGEIENKACSLERIRRKKKENAALIEEVQKEKPSFDLVIESAELKHLIETWETLFSIDPKKKKEDLLAYLKHRYHLLSIEEKMVQENYFSSPTAVMEMQGMDLESVKRLFMDTSQELESSRLKKREWFRAMKEVVDPQCTISSLSSLSQETVFRDLINKAHLLSLHLCDEKNYTPKERERFREELQVEKSFLVQYISEMMQREVLQSSLLEEKLHALQKNLLDRLNQEISILEQQAQEYVDKKIEKLQEEKNLLIQRRNFFKEEMEDIPKKWKKERELHFKTEMGLKAIEALSEFIESKTLFMHLHRVESKPIDLAMPPLKPLSPYLTISLFGALFLGGFLSYLLAFFRGVYRGFDLSQDSLRGYGFSVGGLLSSSDEQIQEKETLESLRTMMAFLERKEASSFSSCVALLLLNGGPHYVLSLAYLLRKKGKKVLVMETSFPDPSTRGWMDFLEKKCSAYPIEQREFFDFLAMGEENLYKVEMLGSQIFREMIASLKEKYDTILLSNNAPLKSMESQILLPLSDVLFITYKKETLFDIKPFTDWANFGNKSKLMFMGIKK